MTLQVVDDLLHQWQDDPIYSPLLERAANALRDANPHEWLLAYRELPEGLQISIDKADAPLTAFEPDTPQTVLHPQAPLAN